MPQLISCLRGLSNVEVESYPTRSQRSSGKVSGVLTEVVTTSFADKILITISQEGRLAQWMQVPLGSLVGHEESGTPAVDDTEYLPLPHLTATTLFGASNQERETTGQLYATQIASSIMAKRPDESRILLVGLGLGREQPSREQFFDLLELILKTI